MIYLKAECLRDEGSISECMEVARSLAESPLSLDHPLLAARAYTLLAVAQQGLGRLPDAVSAAAAAANLVAGNAEYVYLHVEAQRALIAALAESRRLDEAWDQCLLLEGLLTELVVEDTAGKAYWVIGNVAFLSGRLTDGGRYHDMAAESLSPSKDVDLLGQVQPRLRGNAPGGGAHRPCHPPVHPAGQISHRGGGRQRPRPP